MRKWPTLSNNLLFLPFEYFCTNSLKKICAKYDYFYNNDEQEQLANISFYINDNLGIFVNVYQDEKLKLKEKLKVTFIENEFSEALLGLAVIGKKDDDTNSIEKSLSYRCDLNRSIFPISEKN